MVPTRGTPLPEEFLQACRLWVSASPTQWPLTPLTARGSLVLRACKIVRACPPASKPNGNIIPPGRVASWGEEERQKSMSLALSQSRIERGHRMVGRAVVWG